MEYVGYCDNCLFRSYSWFVYFFNSKRKRDTSHSFFSSQIKIRVLLLAKEESKFLMGKRNRAQETWPLFLFFIILIFFFNHTNSTFRQAYQTVIIVVTLVLTSIFFYYTYLMYGNTKNKAKGVKQFVIVVGGSFNVAYFVRTGTKKTKPKQNQKKKKLTIYFSSLIPYYPRRGFCFLNLSILYPLSHRGLKIPTKKNPSFFSVSLSHSQILMMSFLLVQFNIRYFKAIASAVSDSANSRSNTASGMHTSHITKDEA